jgi:hypothetical protein
MSRSRAPACDPSHSTSSESFGYVFRTRRFGGPGLVPPAHFFTRSEYGDDAEVAHDPPLLYHLDHDPGERFDVAARHPDAVAALRKLAADHAKTLRPVENQLAKRDAR